MDVRLRELASAQADIVAGWQLIADGWTHRMIDDHTRRRGWRAVHRGVYALTYAPLSRRQRWIAATLTTPTSVLSHASAAACWGFRPFHGGFETITRPGNGGRRVLDGLLVSRSTTLEAYTTHHDGIAITTAPRVLVEIAPGLTERALGKAFREALRLKTTTADAIAATVSEHWRRRGTAKLAELARRYGHLPYRRTRSDAEARGLEVLDDAGIEPPRVNMTIAGEEADLVWPRRRLIIEIDGPQYHQFAAEDARKQGLWERAGYTVRRLSSDDVFYRPERLVRLANVHMTTP